MFKKILIANRGEVAMRILRACQSLGIQTVIVHSTADDSAKYLKLADESVCVGPPAAKDSYLNIKAILSVAELCNVDAIHPGIGFLSENALFADMVTEHGYVFIGPSSEHIRVMGDKVQARCKAIELGIPTIRGSDGTLSSLEEAYSVAKDIGYPILLKATAGGGGRGMRVCYSENDLAAAFADCSAEAQGAFSCPDLYMEQYLENPRHIEVQIIGDQHGNVTHLGERDCSIQRRHQKVIEETPSPFLSEKEREYITQLSVDAARQLQYVGVGTFEYLYENGKFYFIEMNTRLQVEHTVTEEVYRIDLVQEQIRVAMGLPLSFDYQKIKPMGHAIECRINAENPETFMPSPGIVQLYHVPGGYGVRVDSHLYAGYMISPYYDSLLAKLVVYGANRDDAIQRLSHALEEFVVTGVHTTIPLHKKILCHPSFTSGCYSVPWLEKVLLAPR